MSDQCCAHIERGEGECRRCVAGAITLPASLYDPAEIPCPWCQPHPGGFPGLRANPGGHWLIPPMPATDS